jgi:hypothetical protein
VIYKLSYDRHAALYHLSFGDVVKPYLRTLEAFKWLSLCFEPGDTLTWEDTRP